MTQVLADPVQDDRRKLDLAHDRVTAPAEQTTNATRLVVMVDHQVARRGLTEQASAALDLAHLLNLLRREVVLPAETRAKVFLSRGFGVPPAPLSQALISPFAVGLAVLAVTAPRAVAALVTGQSPVGEVGLRELAVAAAADGHMTIMPRNTAMLDQPCHADVLLRIANEEVSR